MQRIPMLDIWRGFAIVGTLGTNIWLYAALTNSRNDYLLGGRDWWVSWDSALAALFIFLMNGKFLTMLTILFGVGLEIKRQQALRNNWKWPGLYLWGAFLLLIDGFLHFLFVIEVDVLMSYAVTAMIVAYLVRLPERRMFHWVYVAGGIHLLNVILVTIFSGGLTDVTLASPIYASGSWSDQIEWRWGQFWLLRAEAIFIIPQNICLFIVGVLMMRRGVFDLETGLRRDVRSKMLRFGLWTLPFNLLVFLPSDFTFIPARYLFAPTMAILYMALLAYAYERRSTSLWFHPFKKIGKMALSNYMLQNLVASILFFGWGFGLGLYDLSAWQIIFAWALIVLWMTVFSFAWLKVFKTGPFEWIWRKLTIWPRRLESSKKTKV